MLGVGSTAIGGSALVGSGAFSFVRAERDVEIDVVADEDAYLGLEANSAYASGTEEGQLALHWNGEAEGVEGSGLNENADSRFDDVFIIRNQGTNDARISFHDTEGEVGYDSPGATWYYSESEGWEDNEVNADNPVIGSGDSLYIHVIFWLTENDEGDLPDHLAIVAEEP